MYSELIGNYKKYRIKSLYGNTLTINSLANQMRILENNLSEISLVLGQLFVPLMERALPVVNGLTVAIKRLLVNIAGLLGVEIGPSKFGQGFTSSEDEMNDFNQELEDSQKALEEYKNQLMGFDEVNKLQDQSATTNLDVSADELDLTDKILEATEEYEKVWQEAYARMENTADEWAKYFEKFTKPIEKVFESIKLGDNISLGENVSGLALEITEFLKKAVKKINWNELGVFVGEFLTGGLAVAFGGLGKGTSLVFDVGSGIAEFLGSAIRNINFVTLAGAIVYGIADSIKESAKGRLDIWNSLLGLSTGEEYYAVDVKVIADYEKAKKAGVELSEYLSNMDTDVLNTGFGKYAFIETMSEKYFELAQKVNRTAEEEENLARYREQLINSSEDIAEILENETTSYQEQADAIKQVIENLKKKAIQQAASEKLTELYQEQLEQAEDLADAEKDLSTITNKKTTLEYSRARIEKKLLDLDKQAAKAHETNKEEYLRLCIAIDEYKGELAKTDAELEAVTKEEKMQQEIVNQLRSNYDQLTSKISLYADVAAGVKDANDIIQNSNERMVESFADAEAKVEEIYGSFKNVLSGNTYDKLLSDAVAKANQKFSNLQFKAGLTFEVEYEFMDKTKSSTAEEVASYLVGATAKDVEEINKFLGIKNKWSIGAYATGGFPEDGLFFANHGELVGKFSNGKTAVANNEQIVSGIKAGVYDAVSSAILDTSGNGGNVTVVLQGDADGLFRVVQNKANNYARQTGQPAFII